MYISQVSGTISFDRCEFESSDEPLLRLLVIVKKHFGDDAIEDEWFTPWDADEDEECWNIDVNIPDIDNDNHIIEKFLLDISKIGTMTYGRLTFITDEINNIQLFLIRHGCVEETTGEIKALKWFPCDIEKL